MNRKFIITILWIAVAIGLLSFFVFTPAKEQTLENLVLSILISGMYSFVLGLGNGIVNEFLSKKYSWVDDTKTRTILGIVATVAINVLGVFLCSWIAYNLIHGHAPKEFFSGNMAVSNWVTINIALLVSAVLHAKDFMEEWKKSAKQQVTEQKIIAKSASAQFESLKNQLDPHFLFNSLNVLSALIDENPDQAQHFTDSMSRVYRYVLDQKEKELVTVEEELEFARTYCEMLKTRFEDSVSFQFEVRDEVKRMFVVPLSLQLLLENAIKHNFATSAKPLQIKIFSEHGFLCVENSFQPRETGKDREGIGLSNILQRYSLLTDKRVVIENSENYFKVKIPILTEKLSNMKITTENDRIAYRRAERRVGELKGFYGNLASYCIIIPALIFINLSTSPEHQWFWWPMLGWGIGVASHAFKVFGIGSDWEERQIRKYLDQQNSEKWK